MRLYSLQINDVFLPEDNTSSSTIFGELKPNEYRILRGLLESLKQLDDNWNGFEARKPSDTAINAAIAFIGFLNWSKKAYPDQIYPDGDSGVVLKWTTRDEKILLVFDAGLLHLAHDYGSSKPATFENDIPYAPIAEDQQSEQIPSIIKSHLPNEE